MSDLEILQNYNKAYTYFLICPDSELEKAEAELAYWRHLFFL